MYPAWFLKYYTKPHNFHFNLTLVARYLHELAEKQLLHINYVNIVG